MHKILVLGSATQDIFIMYEGAETLHLQSKKGSRSFLILEAGIKANVEQLFYATGGGATNTAVSFKRLGLQAIPCFKLGTDTAGTFIVESLKKENLDLSHISTSSTVDTARSFIIPTPEKNHAALCYRGAQTGLTHHDIPFESLHTYRCLYISSLSGSSLQLLPTIAQKAKKLGILVATNPGVQQITSEHAELFRALSSLDILILNAHEARLFMEALLNQVTIQGTSSTDASLPPLLHFFIEYKSVRYSLFDYFKVLISRGVGTVIVTDGVRGVYVGTASAVYFHPSIPTSVLTAVGAGDAFGSSFVGSLIVGKSLEEALVSGVINASSVISYVDTKTGLLSLKELETRVRELGFTQLQKFAL